MTSLPPVCVAELHRDVGVADAQSEQVRGAEMPQLAGPVEAESLCAGDHFWERAVGQIV
jgi:hypothetical protein